MFRTRHRSLFLMAAAIVGAIGFASSAWAADALTSLEYPAYLGSVTINSNSGQNTGISFDLSGPANGPTTAFGSLAVPNGNFTYVNPNSTDAFTGNAITPYTSMTGYSAVFDAIVDGGAQFTTNYNNYSGPTPQGITTTLNNTGGTVQGTNGPQSVQGNVSIGMADNNYVGWTNWQGLDVSGATNTSDSMLIAPTWLGDSQLRGVVDSNDLVNWSYAYTQDPALDLGYTVGTPWQNGDWVYESPGDALGDTTYVTTDSLVPWSLINQFFADVPFPGFTNSALAPSAAQSVSSPAGSFSAVPEPATWSLLVAAAATVVAVRFRRRLRTA